jgi:hypothetical protein
MTFMLMGLLFLLGGLLLKVSGGVPRVVVLGERTATVKLLEGKRLPRPRFSRRD